MYAENTSVPVGRSQEEIKKVLVQYGATAFGVMESKDKAAMTFELKGKRMLFKIPLPVYGKELNEKRWLVGEERINQMIRAKWRALCLAIKAKLVCVDAGISTLEEEFLSNIVLPDGNTFGDTYIPQIDHVYKTKQLPPLLGGR